MQQLATLERTLARRYYETQIGRTLDVLVERLCGDRPGWVRGTDRHYIPILMPGTKRDLGSCVAARGVSAGFDFLEAQP